MSADLDLRQTVGIILRTEQMPDGTWATHMTVHGMPNESMAEAAMAHMEALFCGDEIEKGPTQ